MKRAVIIALSLLLLAGTGFGQWWKPPVKIQAAFTIAPLIPEAGESVQFTDLSTGPVAGWVWRFGDGAMAWKKNPTHTYRLPGEYAASLTVRDWQGRTRTLVLRVLIVPAMRADFTWTPTEPVETLPVMFTDLSDGLDVARWQWDFGDGGWSEEQNPVHTYAKAGTYVVTLTIWDSAGAKSQTHFTMKI